MLNHSGGADAGSASFSGGITQETVVYKGPHDVAVQDIEMAHIDEPTDALLKATSAARRRLHESNPETSSELEAAAEGHYPPS